MAVKQRFWRSSRWRRALRPDAGLDEAEGLAAGTGLLTGTVAKTAPSAEVSAAQQPCASCGGTSEIIVVDLVAYEATLRCTACGRRWTTKT